MFNKFIYIKEPLNNFEAIGLVDCEAHAVAFALDFE